MPRAGRGGRAHRLCSITDKGLAEGRFTEGVERREAKVLLEKGRKFIPVGRRDWAGCSDVCFLNHPRGSADYPGEVQTQIKITRPQFKH